MPDALSNDPLANPAVPVAAGVVALFLCVLVAMRARDEGRLIAIRMVVLRITTTTAVLVLLSTALARQGMGGGNPFIRGVVQAFVSIVTVSVVSVITLHHVGQIAPRPTNQPRERAAGAVRGQEGRLSGRRIGLFLVGIIVVLGAVLATVAAHER